MGYIYENSNAERFQHLCQSLLIPSFPGLQCFPVGQPDGGRDGWDPDSKTVLQVKFKRSDELENAGWMIEALQKELPKIRRLESRGAKRYIMATNARGTSHQDVGRIDIVQKWLDENLTIPAVCFWRDEIDRRFDDSSEALKLKYSEALSLEDGISVVLSRVLGGNLERQRDALNAFVQAQFDSDQMVKFKQVSLSNDLLDLFIDVPVGLDRGAQSGGSRSAGLPLSNIHKFVSAINGLDGAFLADLSPADRSELLNMWLASFDRKGLGAAEVLVGGAAQTHLKLVVLEGAPGQGKSTLAQYVSQVHRIRYLGEEHLLDQIPSIYKQAQFRVPIKVDLRDYAAFLGGSSPFSSDSAPSSPLTLEVFVSQMIAHQSGGIAFNAHDVVSLLKSLPILLFLDGLDEVADVAARESLVASVGEAVSRWKRYESDTQVVITSRPSVFGRAPSLAEFGFVTLTLQNIDRDGIIDYTDKWLLARGLDGAEERDVRKILSEKLELAHIRDLTRNPMQLTILLSLIHQIGHSLPDQRTDLYSRYVDLFLTREADKSALVRDNRAVLLGFIQHLAWILQIQAETSESAGSVSASNLQEMAREYLVSRGHDFSLAADLFGGGLERIFVLVERIEGLYEFEVQPLREYFCAQHLYATAPIGTYRDEDLRGDRAQRFEALAANPFWLNVCRFYAGSCTRGETGTLVLSLKEMIGAGDAAVAIHARRVGIALLQDWVFSNVKFIQNELISAVLGAPGLHHLLASMGSDISEIVLAEECGRDTLRQEVFDQLIQWPVGTRAGQLCLILRANGGNELGDAFADLLEGTSGVDRSVWITRMIRSGAISGLDAEVVWTNLVADAPDRESLLGRLSELLSAEPEFFSTVPQAAETFIGGVIDGVVQPGGHGASAVGIFADTLLDDGPHNFAYFRHAGKVSLIDHSSPTGRLQQTPQRVRQFFVDAMQSEALTSEDLFNSGALYRIWRDLAESVRRCFGDVWIAYALAVRGAGHRNMEKLADGADRLFNGAVPLVDRARFARLKRGGPKWWLDQLADADSQMERRFWAALVISWSSVANVRALAAPLGSIVDSLDFEEYDALLDTISLIAGKGYARADRKKPVPVDARPYPAATARLVAQAFAATPPRLLLSKEQYKSEKLAAFLARAEMVKEAMAIPSEKDASQILSWASRLLELQSLRIEIPFEVYRKIVETRMRPEVCAVVLLSPANYPPEFVYRATMQTEGQYRPRSLVAVADVERWDFS